MTIPEAKQMIRTAPLGAAPQTWLDLGCGSGVFTQALAELLPPGSEVIGVDQRPQRLPSGTDSGVRISFEQLNMENIGQLPSPIDGVLMANALHYVREQTAYLRQLEALMPRDPRFLFIEYDTNSGNPWIPYPIPWLSLPSLFPDTALIEQIGQRASVYNRSNLYAASVVYQSGHQERVS